MRQEVSVPKIRGEVQNDPRTKTSECEEEETECSICLGVLDDTAGVQQINCGHQFHTRCLDAWLDKCREMQLPATCPYCRCQFEANGAIKGVV